MSVSARLRILLALALVSAASWTAAQQAAPPKLIEEKSGAVTNVSVEGQLAPTRKLDCIAPADVTSDETPPDIHTAVRSCIAGGDFDRAAELFAMAGAFGAFDGQRVADASSRDAPQVLAYMLSGGLSPEQRTDLAKSIARLGTAPALRREVCAAAAKVGAPTYVPTYMIRHGLNAITNPASTSDPLVPDFDAKATWTRVRTGYLSCAA